MSFLSTIGDIAVEAGTEFAKTGAKAVAGAAFGDDSGSKSRRRAGGLGSPSTEPIRFNKTDTTTERGEIQKAKSVNAEEVWDKDPMTFSFEWMNYLGGGSNNG